MTYFVLLVALAALLHAYVNHRRIRVLREDLRQVHRMTRARLEDMDRTVREAREEAAAAKREVSKSNRKSTGKGSWFTPYMTIQDALNLHPGVKGVLASMHIGGCSSCSVSSRETLEQAAAGHGVSLDEMLEKMNALMDDEPQADLLGMLAATPKTPEEARERELQRAADDLPPANGGRIVLGMAGSADRPG
ncbi:MAG: DUF1858 domain-containing protein [Candidatus Sumerlaeia bacterium]|nr:DUF1858 domain-containing protein [Candidatus Sumerlaeia bacterium]